MPSDFNVIIPIIKLLESGASFAADLIISVDIKHSLNGTLFWAISAFVQLCAFEPSKTSPYKFISELSGATKFPFSSNLSSGDLPNTSL